MRPFPPGLLLLLFFYLPTHPPPLFQSNELKSGGRGTSQNSPRTHRSSIFQHFNLFYTSSSVPMSLLNWPDTISVSFGVNPTPLGLSASIYSVSVGMRGRKSSPPTSPFRFPLLSSPFSRPEKGRGDTGRDPTTGRSERINTVIRKIYPKSTAA